MECRSIFYYIFLLLLTFFLNCFRQNPNQNFNWTLHIALFANHCKYTGLNSQSCIKIQPDISNQQLPQDLQPFVAGILGHRSILIHPINTPPIKRWSIMFAYGWQFYCAGGWGYHSWSWIFGDWQLSNIKWVYSGNINCLASLNIKPSLKHIYMKGFNCNTI